MHHQKKKSKHNEYQRKHREARNKLSVEFAIKRFHEITNQGPLYVPVVINSAISIVQLAPIT